MTVSTGVAVVPGGLPPRTITPSPADGVPPGGGDMVPPGATAPVWQPWAEVQANAQSRLKTETQAGLRAFDRTVTDAGRLLDSARAIADQQAKQLEAAAWAAWNKYMAQAREIHDAVMAPALSAYTDTVTAAHSRLRHELGKVNDAYNRILSDVTWTQQITNPPSASM